MDRDFSPEHPYSQYHVAILNFRGPITFNTWETIDGVETQIRGPEIEDKLVIKKYLREFQESVLRKAEAFKSDLIEVYPISNALYVSEEIVAQGKDMKQGAYLALIVFLYMSFHMGSIFLGCLCMI